jgi:hypothetical protein
MKTPVTRRQALAATSALALAFAANADEPKKVGMQLILAADVSGSVNSARYKTQQDGYLEALGDSRVLKVIAELDPPVLAIAFVAWAREQAVMVPWMRVQDAKSMELFRNRLKQTQRPQIGINTLISKALLFCDARFDQEFTGGRKVIDVSGDGDDNQGIAALHDVRDAESSGDRALMNPITGIAAGCARAESGHPTVAPPSSAMSSRRRKSGIGLAPSASPGAE